MQAIGPLKTNSPAETAALVAHYFAWIDGKRQDPPAPPRPISADLERRISTPGTATAGIGAMRRRQLCISIEDHTTPRAVQINSAAAARYAAAHRTGSPAPAVAAGGTFTRTTTTNDPPGEVIHFRTVNTPPAAGNPNRAITRGPRNPAALYPSWGLSVIDIGREIFNHPEALPPSVKPA